MKEGPDLLHGMATTQHLTKPQQATPFEVIPLAVDTAEWESFTDLHPDANAFHKPSWATMLAECYGSRPFALVVRQADGQIAGGLPVMEARGLRGKRWSSLPFTDACAPLLTPDVDAKGFAEALERARARANIRSFIVRADVPTLGTDRNCAAVTHSMMLTDDPYRLPVSSNASRGVRRAQRDGVVVRRAETMIELTDTYYRLHVQTRRRLGVPVQPKRFFAALWRHLLDADQGRLLLAYRGSTPIAGAVFLTGPATVTYKFGASDSSYWGLRPNHAVMWDAISWACEDGYATFDFGRSDLQDEGLRSYKSGWGAEEQPLVYTTFSAKFKRQGFAMTGMRAMLRRLPSSVSRAAGEMFYRLAA